MSRKMPASKHAPSRSYSNANFQMPLPENPEMLSNGSYMYYPQNQSNQSIQSNQEYGAYRMRSNDYNQSQPAPQQHYQASQYMNEVMAMANYNNSQQHRMAPHHGHSASFDFASQLQHHRHPYQQQQQHHHHQQQHPHPFPIQQQLHPQHQQSQHPKLQQNIQSASNIQKPNHATALSTMQAASHMNASRNTISTSSSAATPTSNQQLSIPNAMLIPPAARCKGNSCHQCKTNKEVQHLYFCSSKCETPTMKRNCRKKYCVPCMTRWYKDLIPSSAPGVQLDATGNPIDSGWICPSCCNQCVCAACDRKKEQKSNSSGKSSSNTSSQSTPTVKRSNSNNSSTSTSAQLSPIVKEKPTPPLHPRIIPSPISVPATTARELARPSTAGATYYRNHHEEEKETSSPKKYIKTNYENSPYINARSPSPFLPSPISTSDYPQSSPILPPSNTCYRAASEPNFSYPYPYPYSYDNAINSDNPNVPHAAPYAHNRPDRHSVTRKSFSRTHDGEQTLPIHSQMNSLVIHPPTQHLAEEEKSTIVAHRSPKVEPLSAWTPTDAEPSHTISLGSKRIRSEDPSSPGLPFPGPPFPTFESFSSPTATASPGANPFTTSLDISLPSLEFHNIEAGLSMFNDFPENSLWSRSNSGVPSPTAQSLQDSEFVSLMGFSHF